MALHSDVFGDEFLVRAGPRFLTSYYRAWMGTGSEVSLVALDDDAQVIGVLLGSVAPALHYQGMLRRGGLSLATRLVARALSHPRFASELLFSRAGRYARSLLRAGRTWWSSRRHPPASPGDPVPAEGEVTHVAVRAGMRGRGVGRALLDGATAQARAARLASLKLVTTPQLAADGFYDRLGWRPIGAITTSSGEHYVRYQLVLGG